MCNEGVELVLNFQSPASLRGQERKEETLITCMEEGGGFVLCRKGRGKEMQGEKEKAKEKQNNNAWAA